MYVFDAEQSVVPAPRLTFVFAPPSSHVNVHVNESFELGSPYVPVAENDG